MQWWSIKVFLFESVHASYLLSRVVTRPKNEHSPEAMMREAITQITALNAKPHLLFTISIFPVIKHNLGFKKFFCEFLKKLITYGLFNFTLKCISGVLRYHIFLWHQNFTIIMAVRFFIRSSWKELCHSSSNDSPTTQGVHNTTGSLLLMVWWDRPIKLEP